MSETSTIPLLTIREVAAWLACSTRKVHRLRDFKQMPSSLKVGGSVRWERQAIEAWIARGCKPSSN